MCQCSKLACHVFCLVSGAGEELQQSCDCLFLLTCRGPYARRANIIKMNHSLLDRPYLESKRVAREPKNRSNLASEHQTQLGVRRNHVHSLSARHVGPDQAQPFTSFLAHVSRCTPGPGPTRRRAEACAPRLTPRSLPSPINVHAAE